MVTGLQLIHLHGFHKCFGSARVDEQFNILVGKIIDSISMCGLFEFIQGRSPLLVQRLAQNVLKVYIKTIYFMQSFGQK